MANNVFLNENSDISILVMTACYILIIQYQADDFYIQEALLFQKNLIVLNSISLPENALFRLFVDIVSAITFNVKLAVFRIGKRTYCLMGE